MLIPRWVLSVVCSSMIVFVEHAAAQNYPEKPIRIVTSPAGGGNDLVTRLLAQALSSSLGQPVIVDNRGGVVAMETVMKSPPDGYAILLIGRTLWAMPLLQPTYYEPLRDFVPIALVSVEPNVLVVHPSLPAKSVKELIALAKARPGQLNYAAGVLGGSTDLPAKIFAAKAGVNIVRVGYKGGGPALSDLIGGHVHLMFATAASVSGHVGSGRVRALGVTSAQPSTLFPGVPAIASAGVPGYESVGMLGTFAIAKTPPAIITRLNQEIGRAVSKPEVREKFAGMEVLNISPEEFAAKIKAEMVSLSKVIKEAGIRGE